MDQPVRIVAPPPVAAPPERIQRMIHVLLENQQMICQYPSGTLVFQFVKNDVQAKMTYTLPSS